MVSAIDSTLPSFSSKTFPVASMGSVKCLWKTGRECGKKGQPFPDPYPGSDKRRNLGQQCRHAGVWADLFLKKDGGEYNARETARTVPNSLTIAAGTGELISNSLHRTTIHF
jgi:hypothetical protein